MDPERVMAIPAIVYRRYEILEGLLVIEASDSNYPGV